MRYFLLHKNRLLASFELNLEVSNAEIYSQFKQYLPLPLKRILNNQDEFLDSFNGNKYIVNEEGCYLIDMWLFGREVPANREKVEKYGRTSKERRNFMLDNYSCSLTDCYWVKPASCQKSWEEVNLYSYNGIDSLEVVISGGQKHYKGYNSTLGGQLEKFWYVSDYNENKTLKLCKKSERLFDILSIREIIATKVYKNLNIVPYCHYEYVYNRYNEIVGCKCDAYTSEKLELVTAYDLLEEDNLSQVNDVYDKIIEKACFYGADEFEVRKYMDIQTIVDFVILNRDRHQGNIGFLRDSDTLKILCPTPIYDSGSSRHMEMEKPEGITGTTVNGLYTTEDECLEHITLWNLVNTSKFPNSSIIMNELNKSVSLSENRKHRLIELYNGKLNYLKNTRGCM